MDSLWSVANDFVISFTLSLLVDRDKDYAVQYRGEDVQDAVRDITFGFAFLALFVWSEVSSRPEKVNIIFDVTYWGRLLVLINLLLPVLDVIVVVSTWTKNNFHRMYSMWQGYILVTLLLIELLVDESSASKTFNGVDESREDASASECIREDDQPATSMLTSSTLTTPIQMCASHTSHTPNSDHNSDPIHHNSGDSKINTHIDHFLSYSSMKWMRQAFKSMQHDDSIGGIRSIAGIGGTGGMCRMEDKVSSIQWMDHRPHLRNLERSSTRPAFTSSTPPSIPAPAPTLAPTLTPTPTPPPASASSTITATSSSTPSCDLNDTHTAEGIQQSDTAGFPSFLDEGKKDYTPSYTHPIHPLYTPYTRPIHPLYTPYTPTIHTLYTPYTHPIHTLYRHERAPNQTSSTDATQYKFNFRYRAKYITYSHSPPYI